MNGFDSQVYAVRQASGQIHHASLGREFDIVVDHLEQLSSANLIEDAGSISIS